ncbi:hypothetical protein [Desulfonatronospira sp.]|nr:hypothetical protein [Desulfonatronospira sp.]
MSTNEFYDLHLSGKLGDDIKYIRWAGEYETLKKLEQDYQALG